MDIRKFKTKREMEKAHGDDIANFPFVWAFSNKQLEEGMKKKWDLDMNNKEHLKLIMSIPAGGFIRKSDKDAMEEMFDRHTAERKQFAKDYKNLVAVIKSEMSNHEFGYTEDPTDTLSALSDYVNLPRFPEAWKKAKKEFLAEYKAWLDKEEVEV